MTTRPFPLRISIHHNMVYIKLASESPSKIIAAVKSMIESEQIGTFKRKDILVSCTYPAQATALAWIAAPYIESLAVNGAKILPATDDLSDIDDEFLSSSDDSQQEIAQQDIGRLLVGEEF